MMKVGRKKDLGQKKQRAGYLYLLDVLTALFFDDLEGQSASSL